MGFLDRLSTLVRSDAHGVVDALEDKALVLRQHLRDAAGELDRKRALLAGMAAEEQELGDELVGLREAVRALDEDTELALTGGKDELARFAVRKLLPLRHGCRRIEERRVVLAREREALAAILGEQEHAYTELERRVHAHLARLAAADDERPWRWTEPVVRDEDVELELLRRHRGTVDADSEDADSEDADSEDADSEDATAATAAGGAS